MGRIRPKGIRPSHTGRSGLASITGGPETPARVGLSIVDIAAGATAYAAVLEALIARSRNGRGADIRISMFAVMADWLSELERRFHNAADDRSPLTPLQRTPPPIGHASVKVPARAASKLLLTSVALPFHAIIWRLYSSAEGRPTMMRAIATTPITAIAAVPKLIARRRPQAFAASPRRSATAPCTK